MLSILATYLLIAVAVMMYAGVGFEGLGLGNEENADNVFGALADPVLGWAGPLLFLAVLASSVASLQTTFLPAARAPWRGHGRHHLERGRADTFVASAGPFGTPIAAARVGSRIHVRRNSRAQPAVHSQPE